MCVCCNKEIKKKNIGIRVKLARVVQAITRAIAKGNEYCYLSDYCLKNHK